jgi:hypothetical protein
VRSKGGIAWVPSRCFETYVGPPIGRNKPSARRSPANAKAIELGQGRGRVGILVHDQKVRPSITLYVS